MSTDDGYANDAPSKSGVARVPAEPSAESKISGDRETRLAQAADRGQPDATAHKRQQVAVIILVCGGVLMILFIVLALTIKDGH